MLSFYVFLYEYLKEEHCISTTPIIGYINDGTDDVMMSHAWLEYSGTKTDVSLGVTANPILWPTGEVIILDRVIYSGHNYSYHVSMTDAGLQTHYDMLKGPDSALVQQKAEEHLEMLARAKTPQSIRSYLDGAPAGLHYDELSSAIS
ncbi:hypothetical protein [Pseudochrobactrum lubricantis]|uniref:hypothetical protein n=1 Tax=Pseudochrobactrum lubricantis TaxID=558172 RepID=UPI0035DD857A